jgi:hypothetical protein
VILDAREVDTTGRWDRAIWWDPHTPGARPRSQPVRAIVLHWTGAENDGIRVSHNLRHRKDPKSGRPKPLSIHYTVSQDGTTIQHADPKATVTLHAGGVNDWTVGVEIVSAGRVEGMRQVWPRVAYDDTIHGQTRQHLRFLPEQVGAVYDLCQHLCETLDIPWRVPMQDGELIRRQLSDEELADFAGFMGHFHCHPSKRDPGSHLLVDLAGRATQSVLR